MTEYIRKQDAFDAVEARIAELMTHPEFRRKHLDIDLSGIIRNISAIKPADVVPVIHTEWERHMSFGICRNCGYEYDWKATDARNYCPKLWEFQWRRK